MREAIAVIFVFWNELLQAFSVDLMLQTVLDCQGDLGMCCSYGAVARGGNRARWTLRRGLTV